MKLSIKNMVCPRCIAAVQQLLEEMGLQPQHVVLGEAVIGSGPNDGVLDELKQRLQQLGFELLEDSRALIVEKIKAIVIGRIHHQEEGHVIFSELLAHELNRDYSGISKMFSTSEGITIEQFIILQKIEKVKEFLVYNQLTLSEIAYRMGYSSVAHLSAQFRKTTGLTPTDFRRHGSTLRQPLDNVSKTV